MASMTWKGQIVTALVIAFVLYMVFTQPAQAADIVRGAWSGLGTVATGLNTFVSELSGG